MKKTEFIWFNGKLVPWNEANVHVLSHTLHYGGGAFEGIRFYKTDRGPAVFRLDEHIQRLFYSCDTLGITLPYTHEEVVAAIKLTIKENGLESGYVRPLAFWGAGDLRIISKNLPIEFIIACWPIGSYLPSESVDVKISDLIRIHPDSTKADAKLCGHYLNSLLASKTIANTHHHEVLLLDYQGNIAEGAGENFFMVKNNVLFTPKLGNVLAGITRDTVLNIAKQLGVATFESVLTVEDATSCDEAFFSGTAVEITPIRSIDDIPLGSDNIGPITSQVKEAYHAIVSGKNDQFMHYLTHVE